MFYYNRRFRSFKKRSGFNIARNYSEVLLRVFENSSVNPQKSNFNRKILAAGFISSNIRSLDSSECNI